VSSGCTGRVSPDSIWNRVEALDVEKDAVTQAYDCAPLSHLEACKFQNEVELVANALGCSGCMRLPVALRGRKGLTAGRSGSDLSSQTKSIMQEAIGASRVIARNNTFAVWL